MQLTIDSLQLTVGYAAINPIERYLTLGFTTDVNELTLDVTKADQYNTYQRMVTGKSTEYIHDRQPYGTKSHLINPYTEYTDAMKPYYNITVVPVSGATIKTTPARQAKEGELVTVTVTVDDPNMTFKEMLIDGAVMTGNSFTMPANHVTVTAAIKENLPLPKHNITVIPVADGEITTTPPFEAEEGTVVKVNVKETVKDMKLQSIIVNGTAISGDTFTMPNHHATVTATMKSVAPTLPPTIGIVPQVDNWIETNSVVIPRDGGVSVVNSNIDSSGNPVGNTTWWRETGTTSRTETSTSSSTSVLSSAIQFMRRREITVTAERFKPNQEDIIIRFNDVRVTATPTDNKYKGAREGYLKADADGRVQAEITVPANTRCGTVNVAILTEEYAHLVGTTAYTANGTLRTTQTTVTTSRTVYQETIMKYVDPLAQTFSFESDQMLTSIGLYFDVLDRTEDVTVQIRETTNAYPSNIILAEVVIPQSQLIESRDGSLETKITFPNPIYCKEDTQYAFTILTKSRIHSRVLRGA